MANRLIHETSPYLLQHAENPVDWYPWGEDAFEAARKAEKPILLSVGYSACHWCHVMERESFADEAVAARMNESFINVKVDREERPDVDELYMRAVQAFNEGRGGGWPMTVFLTPEGRPFHGGTYYPPVPRHGLPSFAELLAQIEEMWTDRRDEVDQLSAQVVGHLDRTGRMPPRASVLSREWLEPVIRESERAFDIEHGGFGGQPKFPPHGTLSVLLAHHHRTGEDLSIDMATRTLDGMAKGGMYDLLGGGFARYSVDEQWRVPHFEKMLYDNAQLLTTYLAAYRLTGRDSYARVVRETVGWAMREMALEHGGFAASQDADTEGGEGSFFVWTRAQLDDLLGDEAGLVADLLQVRDTGTFDQESSVLRLDTPYEDLAPVEQQRLDQALPKLFEAREGRERPGRDDKVVVAWNGLMVSALARCGAALNEPDWVTAAASAAELLLDKCVVDDRLMRTFKDGQARVPAYADDHVMLVTGCVDLYEATFDSAWLERAITWMDRTLELFWDDTQGGMLYGGSDQPRLVSPSANFLGGAEPGANGVGALTMIRLGRLCGRDDLLDKASHIARAAQAMLGQAPRALGAEALAGAWLAEGGVEVAIVGDPDHEATQAMLAELRSHHLPFAVSYAGASPDAERFPWLEGKTPIDGKPTAYVCEGYTCGLPVHDAEGLAAQLEETRIRVVSPAAPPELRQEAPALPTEADAWLGTDEALPLESLRGRVVVLEFWTSSCVNCLHVLPEVASVQARYAAAPVTVLGVHSSKFTHEMQAGAVRQAMDRHGVEHPVVVDGNRAIWNAYGIRSWPTVVVIDAEGRVAAQRSGEVPAADIGDIVDVLLDEIGYEEPDESTEMVTMEEPKPGKDLRFVGKVHVYPGAWEQEMGGRLGEVARVYLSDSGHHRIIEAAVGSDGGWPTLTVSRVFGSGVPGLVDGASGEARFRNPQGVSRHQDRLYVADTDNHALRMVDLVTGEVSTLAGNGRRGTRPPTMDQLRAPTTASLRSPWAVEVMPFRSHHIVFIAMAGNHQVWVYGAGHLGIHAGSGREDHVDGPAAVAALAQPSELALYGRYLLLADTEVSSIRAVDLQSHQLVTVVGRGLFDFGDIDGPSDRARLQHPLGLTFAGESVYVADTYNHKIKAVGLADGSTTTLAGGDDAFDEPSGIARLGQHLLVADSGNHRIRAVAIDGGQVRDVPLVWD